MSKLFRTTVYCLSLLTSATASSTNSDQNMSKTVTNTDKRHPAYISVDLKKGNHRSIAEADIIAPILQNSKNLLFSISVLKKMTTTLRITILALALEKSSTSATSLSLAAFMDLKTSDAADLAIHFISICTELSF